VPRDRNGNIQKKTMMAKIDVALSSPTWTELDSLRQKLVSKGIICLRPSR
jgi:hypothetical protein